MEYINFKVIKILKINNNNIIYYLNCLIIYYFLLYFYETYNVCVY